MQNRRFNAEILANEEVAPGVFSLRLRAKELAEAAAPGQFVHVCVTEPQSSDPLLRRPFSICDVDYDRVHIVYEVRGRGTRLLSEREGGLLDLLGPLGTGFRLPEKGHRVVLVGGGIGIPPMVFLARKVAEMGGNLSVVLGACTGDSALGFCIGEFCVPVRSCVEREPGELDAEIGLVTDLLQRELPADVVYACGPMPMLAAVAEIAKGVACQVSTEAKMACGVGACMGCVIKTKGGYVRCCKEGPVFDAEEIVW
ncbi:MAG: dihydroorotate dehydrogenase electron transfer subunit [Armatimonadota bacterium]